MPRLDTAVNTKENRQHHHARAECFLFFFETPRGGDDPNGKKKIPKGSEYMSKTLYVSSLTHFRRRFIIKMIESSCTY